MHDADGVSAEARSGSSSAEPDAEQESDIEGEVHADDADGEGDIAPAGERDAENAVLEPAIESPADSDPESRHDAAIDEAASPAIATPAIATPAIAEPAVVERAVVEADAPSSAETDVSHEREAEPATEDLRRTEVIHVGERAEDEEEGEQRRGWWQRLMS